MNYAPRGVSLLETSSSSSNDEANLYRLSYALFSSSKSLSLTPSHSLNNGEGM